MGVVSRRVLPACGSLCFLCPSLRARSRQPVKRYKKFLADIFPRSQDAEPNDRKISKLCEYASKNPLRIPKITMHLEQRCYKDLRNEHFNSAKVVLCIYRKLLSSCKEQMPLFAPSLLCIIRTLLDEAQQDEMQILGSDILVDFIESQMDSSYLFNLEGLIPKLCRLAQEFGEDERGKSLQTAGLRSLAVLVCFMGQHSHISMDLDDIVSVILENYGSVQIIRKVNGLAKEKFLDKWKQVPNLQREDQTSVDTVDNNPSSEETVHNKCTADITNDAKNPTYWSRVCLQNMIKVAKEATTLRRVMEPLFRTFDSGNHWSLQNGLALSILIDIQHLLESSGQKTHLLIAMLVKHLDHKNVVKQPDLQVNIVEVITHVAFYSKAQVPVEIVGSISELIRYMRKCIHHSLEPSHLGDDQKKLWKRFLSALDDCILQLITKVGDTGPILDMMAVMLENLSSNTILSRATMSSVCRTAQLVAIVSDILYHGKVFPEALLHQLLIAMFHPDHETRVGAHCIFSVICAPSSAYFWKGSFHSWLPRKLNNSTTFEMTSCSDDLSIKTCEERIPLDNGCERCKPDKVDNGDCTEPTNKMNGDIKRYSVHPSRCQSHNIELHPDCSITDGRNANEPEKNPPMCVSSDQVGLLFTSIWVQATSPGNTPANFEAIAHTYALLIYSSRLKASNHGALIRSFQLALSLRDVSLDKEGSLQPSHRRSLFTLANSMILLLGKAYNIIELLHCGKLSLDKMVDPYLRFTEEYRLQDVLSDSDTGKNTYGSKEDDLAALELVSSIQVASEQSKEHLADTVVHSLGNLSEEEYCSIHRQLLQEFSPDDAFSLGAPFFMDTSRPGSPFTSKDYLSFDEMVPLSCFSDEEPLPEVSRSQSHGKMSLSSSEVLSVKQLMDSVLEATMQVANVNVSSAPVPYDQMKNQCEALVIGKQKKMAVLLSVKHPQAILPIDLSSDADSTESISPHKEKMDMPEEISRLAVNDYKSNYLSCSSEYFWSFRLPPASPFDKFLKAAGC